MSVFYNERYVYTEPTVAVLLIDNLSPTGLHQSLNHLQVACSKQTSVRGGCVWRGRGSEGVCGEGREGVGVRGRGSEGMCGEGGEGVGVRGRGSEGVCGEGGEGVGVRGRGR